MQERLEEISLAVQKIYREAIDPLSTKYSFHQRPPEGEVAGAPMVLLLGNHSSGKSTFINNLLGEEVQKTGLAPTDDSFTIIRHGANVEERDGEAVTSNPEYPFAGLRAFGPAFLTHFRMKIRPVDLLKNVTLVDSPGMIDAATPNSGRGYDFAGVARWFAERADVVLVFFDPDKPGTTGETLQVFTQSLSGIDHKLLIVMNKMDLFRTLPDFARAYGALCWNLGKVIPRKDLPHIYTTFVPVEGAAAPSLPMSDFEKAREELVGEIRRAPARRVDNMITQLQNRAERLKLHARIIDATARDVRRFRLKLWGLLALVILFGGLAGVVSMLLRPDAGLDSVSAGIFGATLLFGFGGYYVIRGLVQSESRKSIGALPAVFERVHAKELLVRDRSEDLQALWEHVHPQARRALQTLGVLAFPALKRAEIKRLNHTLETELPDLRAKLHREMMGSA